MLFPEEVTRKFFYFVLFLPVFPLTVKYCVGCNCCSLHPVLAKVFLCMTRAHPGGLLSLGDMTFLSVTTVGCSFTCIASFSGLKPLFPTCLLRKRYLQLRKYGRSRGERSIYGPCFFFAFSVNVLVRPLTHRNAAHFRRNVLHLTSFSCFLSSADF